MKVSRAAVVLLGTPTGAAALSAALGAEARIHVGHLRGPRSGAGLLAVDQVKYAVHGACVDEPADWRSNTSSTCQDYENFKWCTPDGDYGPGWNRADGTFDDWRNKASAVDACCACGGGDKVDILISDLNASACPEGAPINDAALCKAAASAMERDFAGADSWQAGHAYGCHTDERKSTVWFNSDKGAKNDGKFSLVCIRDAQVVHLGGQNVTNLNKDDDDDDDEDDDDKDDGKDDDKVNKDGKGAAKGAAKLAPAPKANRTKVFSDADKKRLATLRAAVHRTREELSKDMKQLIEVQGQLQGLDSAAATPTDIESGMQSVMKETKSEAMAGLVGDMWKEMRMFNTPFYEEQLREKASYLKMNGDRLKVEATTAEKTLKQFESEKGFVAV